MNATEQAAMWAAKDAARNRPKDFAAFEDLGFCYFGANRLHEAMSALQRAIALNPGTASAYNKIGWIHYQLGASQPAITGCEEAIPNDPHFHYAYDGLGYFYAPKRIDYDRAIDAYESGLEDCPGDPYLTAALGSTYARMGQMEKAIEILEQSAQEHPDLILACSWLSYLYLRLKRLEEAAASCRRGMAFKANAHSGHRMLGYIHRLQGRNDDAAAELEQAIELEPLDYEARGALANVYQRLGNLPAAEYQYHTGYKLAVQDNEYGQSCFHAVYGNVDQALDLLETGVARGQLKPGWIRIDPELVFIQDEPRFQSLACSSPGAQLPERSLPLPPD